MEVRLHAPVDSKVCLSPGWQLAGDGPLPTFTTARPRVAPGNIPAGLWQCDSWEIARWVEDKHRYPPYVYRDKNCLKNETGAFGLPSISEKEVIMGFPLHYTEPCVAKGRQEGETFSDLRHSLIGNAWHVPVISWLLCQLFAPLGLTECHTLGQAVEACSPGKDRRLQGFLARPPLVPIRQSVGGTPEEVLTKKLVNFVSVKGEDLMVQAPSENVVKFHRLRASVPSKLWRWRTICGWPWQHKGCHQFP